MIHYTHTHISSSHGLGRDINLKIFFANFGMMKAPNACIGKSDNYVITTCPINRCQHLAKQCWCSKFGNFNKKPGLTNYQPFINRQVKESGYYPRYYGDKINIVVAMVLPVSYAAIPLVAAMVYVWLSSRISRWSAWMYSCMVYRKIEVRTSLDCDLKKILIFFNSALLLSIGNGCCP